MKAHWHKNKIIIFSFLAVCGFTRMAFAQSTPGLTRKGAMVFAEQTLEAKALYELKNGKYVNCIQKSVLRPCDTDWVTCVDNAWVVKFQISEACKVFHDGRIDLVMLVDALDKRVISRYPEKEYYKDPEYCMLDDECMMLSDQKCYNFIYGQLGDDSNITQKGSFSGSLLGGDKRKKNKCGCRDGVCRVQNN